MVKMHCTGRMSNISFGRYPPFHTFPNILGKKKKMQFCRWDQIQSIYREESASKVVQFRAGWRVNPVGRECHQSKWEICIEPT